MAEVGIERTRERTLWPWILALLLVAAVAWYLMAERSAPAAEGPLGLSEAEGAPLVRPASGAVGNYLQYVQDRAARTEAGLDREFAAHGVRLLASALEAVAGEAAAGGETRAQLGAIRMLADSVQRTPGAGADARHAREAFLTTANLMASLQAQRYPNIGERVAAVREAATNLSVRLPLDEQQPAVSAFFERAADALRSMAPQAV